VHYLHSNKELSPRLGDYLELVNSGVEPIKAFEDGFGISPKEFHVAARKYFRDNKFQVQQFQPKAEFMDVKVKRKRLTKPELNMKMALGQRAFLRKKNAGEYSKKLNSYESGKKLFNILKPRSVRMMKTTRLLRTWCLFMGLLIFL